MRDRLAQQSKIPELILGDLLKFFQISYISHFFPPFRFQKGEGAVAHTTPLTHCFFNLFHRSADRCDLLHGSGVQLNIKFFLDAHDDLEHVQGVGPQVFHKGRILCESSRVYVHHFRDDRTEFFKFHRSCPPFSR